VAQPALAQPGALSQVNLRAAEIVLAALALALAAAAWFQGANDAGQLMWDAENGGGFDGLRADGVNRNQGAESTLAVLSTLQHARRFSTVPQ